MTSVESNVAPETKVQNLIFDFDTENISELRLFLKSLHISFKSQSLENTRILSELSVVKERNNQVEAELLCMKGVQAECDKTKHINAVIQKKFETLEKELASEKAIINKWQNSGKNSSKMFEGNNWRRGLGYDKTVETPNQQQQVKSKNTVEVESKLEKMEPRMKFRITPIKFISTAELEQGSTSKIEKELPAVKIQKPIKDKSSIKRTPASKERINVGLLSQKQLKKRIGEVTKTKVEPTVKRNRNGKIGINKENNYKNIPNAPRKTCFNCGSSNHLAIDCRKNKRKTTAIPNSDIRNRAVFYKPQNPCFHCGSKWH